MRTDRCAMGTRARNACLAAAVLLLLLCGAASAGSWTKIAIDRQLVNEAVANAQASLDGGACADYDQVDKSTLEFDDDPKLAPWAPEHITVWRSDTVTAVFDVILEQTILHDLNMTLRDIFQVIQHGGCRVYPHGGVVRDTILGLEFNDLDITFNCSATRVGEIAEENGWPAEVEEQYQYVKIGFPEECFNLEGNHMNVSITEPLVDQEFSTNSLAFDVNGNNVIIDSATTGMNDTCHRRIRIPADRGDWDDWTNASPKKLLRFWKLRAKEYSVDDETLNYVVEKVKGGWDTTGMKGVTSNFICRSLIGGNVTNTNPPCTLCCPMPTKTRQKLESWMDAARSDFGEDWFEEHMADLALYNGPETCKDIADASPNLGPSTALFALLATLIIGLLWLI